MAINSYKYLNMTKSRNPHNKDFGFKLKIIIILPSCGKHSEHHHHRQAYQEVLSFS